MTALTLFCDLCDVAMRCTARFTPSSHGWTGCVLTIRALIAMAKQVFIRADVGPTTTWTTGTGARPAATTKGTRPIGLARQRNSSTERMNCEPWIP